MAVSVPKTIDQPNRDAEGVANNSPLSAANHNNSPSPDVAYDGGEQKDKIRVGQPSQTQPHFRNQGTSIPVSREHRRAKADRLDLGLMKRSFLGWLRSLGLQGEKRHSTMVAVPPREEDDGKRPLRERDRLVADTTRLVEEIPFREPANENYPPFVPANYWQDLAASQETAGLVIELAKVELAIAEHGGGSKAVCVFDNWETDQIHSSHMYLGYASHGSNNKEGVHVHMLQTEFYISLKGTSEIWTKRYWESSNDWERQVLNQGDVAIVWPQTCHFFQVSSQEGITVVTKAPNNMGGVGRGAAKLNCTNCPRLQKGCNGLTAA